MVLAQRLRLWLRELFRKHRVEKDLDDELHLHVELEAAANRKRGMGDAAAHRAALVAFGGMEQFKEACRDERGVARLEELGTDLRSAVRWLRRAPSFSAIVVLVLGLGIGATTAIFSVVNGVLLKPLPYPDPDRLVRVFETAPPSQGGEIRSVAIPTFDDWRPRLRLFQAMGAYGPWSFDLTGGDQPEQLAGASASGSLFRVLGQEPLLGRLFTPEEERPGGPRAVLLGYDLWRRRFGAEPGVIGRTVTLNRQPFTVVGVMRPGFAFPATAELWASLAIDHEFAARGARHISILARLKPGVTLTSARDELLALDRQLAERYPANYTGYGVRLIPLRERIVGEVRPALVILLGAVGFVLLIACVNVANLLLARAAARQREMAVRVALGASRARLLRQLLTEGLVLFALGGALGLLLAHWALEAVRAWRPADIPRLDEVGLDLGVLAFAVGVALGTGLLFGLAPALQGSGPNLQLTLKQGGRAGSSGAQGPPPRLRGALVAAETALAAVLLVGAGLLIKSLQRLSAVDPGFRIEHLLTFHVGLPSEKGSDPAFVVGFFRQVRERLEAIPGVQDVGLASRLPLSGEDHSSTFRLEGETVEPGREHSVQDRAVTPGYFRAVGIPVLRGRELAESDGADAVPVAVINATFARRFFPNQDPVGRRVIVGIPRLIVGVVGDARQFSLDLPAEPEYSLPHAQNPWPWLGVVVRTTGDPLALLPQAQRAIWSLDRELPLTSVRTMEAIAAGGIARRHLVTVLLSVFGGVAFLLAAVGLYGLVAYHVAQRTGEIGIRVALGASRRDVLRLVIGNGMRLAAVGVGVGLAGAAMLTQVLTKLLFEVSQTDPATFAAVALLLPAVALAASYLPARRATRIDPAIALRSE